MSWWDTSNFTNLASQAIKNAQKSIDKALDIGEDEQLKGKASAKAGLPASVRPRKTDGPADGSGGEFWNSWLGAGQKPEDAKDEPGETPTEAESFSSWNLGGWAGKSEPEKEPEAQTSPSSWSDFDMTTPPSGGTNSKAKEYSSTKQTSSPRKTSSSDFTQLSEAAFESIEAEMQNDSRVLGVGKLSDGGCVEIDPEIGQGGERVELAPAIGQGGDDFSRSGRLICGDDDGTELYVLNSSTGAGTFDDSDRLKATEIIGHDPVVGIEGDKSRTTRATDDLIAPVVAVCDTTCDSKEVMTTEVTDQLVVSPDPGAVTVTHGLEENTQIEQSPTSQELISMKPSTHEIDESMQTAPSIDQSLQCSSIPEDLDESAKGKGVDSLVSSSTEMLSISEGVTLEIPSEADQFQIGPSTPLSSEASILTLSSTGQDDFDERGNLQTMSSQQISEYINISTTQLHGIKEMCLDISDPMISDTTKGQMGFDASGFPLSTDTSEGVLSIDASAEMNLDTCGGFGGGWEAAPLRLVDIVSESADTSISEMEYLEKDLADLGLSSGNDSSDTSKLDSSMDTCTSGDTVVEHSHDVLGDSDMEHDFEKSDESFPTTSPNSSFVKNLLEDAMEDVAKPEDSGSDNHSGGDKSESSKVESEIDKSISGHESSDDIETTTSSDIEIISTPNGDRFAHPFDLSPLRIALQKTVRRDRECQSHRRTDSQSSGSTYSKAGESDQLSPGRDSLERHDMESGDEELHAPDLSAVTEEDAENPYHPQKLLQKLAEQAEILIHRENKVVSLSKENNDLLETNSILRNQLAQAEDLRETEMLDLNVLTDEFTKRLSEAERKLQNSIKEKESLKRQLQTVQDELSKSAGDISYQSLLEEKSQQITELLQEGEKLSKQQLQSNNIIKKLRCKEKENESMLTSQKKKVEDQKNELEHLRKVCDTKDEMETKQAEAINQLNSAVQKQEKDILSFKSEQEEFSEKTRSLQTALDNAYKEIAELHKTNAAQDSRAQEAALSAEISVREALRLEMESDRLRQKQEREALIMQIEDLRMSMARMEKEHNRREDMLRQEISDLHVQLQEDEARNQELTHSVSSATRPLLRQIENLQANYNAQSASWEKVERNIIERLSDTQSQLVLAIEKERVASEKLMDQNVRLLTLETQTARLRQEKSQLLAKTEMDKAKVELLEEAKLNEMAQVSAVRTKLTGEMSELKKDKVFLESKLETEKSKLETEKRRNGMLDEQLRMMERDRPRSRGTPSPVSISRQESVSSFQGNVNLLPILPQEDLLERTLMLSSPNGSKMNLYESLRQSGAATLLENLQSQLKQRDGEILQLQSEISSLERTRESMAKELVNLTNRNEELEEQVQELPLLHKQYGDLDSRYNALLQMYGEKVEKAEELRLDLQDIKDMYKAQIDQLLAN